MRITVEQDIGAPAEAAFAAITDIHSWPNVISAIEKIEVLTPGVVGVGTRFRETPQMFGRSATEEMTVARIDPPSQFVLTAHNHGVDYTAAHTIEPAANGCRVAVNFEGEPVKMPARVMAFLMQPLAGHLRRALQKDLDDLKHALERSASAAS